MSYKKYLIVASKLDKAGINITTQLSQFETLPGKESKFKFYLVDDEIIKTENLNLAKINQYDFIIFASKHQSVKQEKTLSVHAPGNWRDAKFGGIPGKICPVDPGFIKHLFKTLQTQVEKDDLRNYKVSMEATHHGPLIEKPCVFIEIGSTEVEWKDRRAGFVIAKAILEAIENFKENSYEEIAFGIGGPHYCPNFNRLQLDSNVAIGHVIPEYALPLTEEMVKEVIDKTNGEIEFALLDWKGLPNAEERKKIIDILDKMYIRHEKTSDISRR